MGRNLPGTECSHRPCRVKDSTPGGPWEGRQARTLCEPGRPTGDPRQREQPSRSGARRLRPNPDEFSDAYPAKPQGDGAVTSLRGVAPHGAESRVDLFDVDRRLPQVRRRRRASAQVTELAREDRCQAPRRAEDAARTGEERGEHGVQDASVRQVLHDTFTVPHRAARGKDGSRLLLEEWERTLDYAGCPGILLCEGRVAHGRSDNRPRSRGLAGAGPRNGPGPRNRARHMRGTRPRSAADPGQADPGGSGGGSGGRIRARHVRGTPARARHRATHVRRVSTPGGRAARTPDAQHLDRPR